MARIQVGDAFVRGRTGGPTWTVGTGAVELTYGFRGGALKVTAFANKLASPSLEYIAEGTEMAPFTVGAAGDRRWTLKAAAGSCVLMGGQPVARLDIELGSDALCAHLHVIAYPGTSVLRQWIELENVGAAPVAATATPLTIPIVCDDARPFVHYWIVGGNSRLDQGAMHQAPVAPGYRHEVSARATSAFIPWTALHRAGDADGFFVALEYLGNWSLSVSRADTGPLLLTAAVPDLGAVQLAPGQKLALPAVTLGAFAGSLDDMGVRAYDWQYRYLWDYTNSDYYARPKWAVPWAYCSRNLQEQFAERLAYLDMDADLARSVGFEMLWDDAGWSSFNGLPPDSYGSVFTPTYEGPDFRQTLRYLEKMDMRWLAWFARRPSPGVMAGKVGSWGDFEWRSDAIDFPDWSADQDWRDKIVRFLDSNPGCSFHTCSGGSSYSHTFDIQRYANTNYFADGGRGPITNYYLSYIEPPDKWVDIIEPWTGRGEYRPATARQTMTMVPFWGLKATAGDQELLRKDLDTYRFLRREGVAGRWSYMFHPGVEGDEAIYYMQRTSFDRLRACIILKRQPPQAITLFPRGLLPEQRYAVEFDHSPDRSERTGADLMANGIALAAVLPGELVYLNLLNRPRSGRDKTSPTPPGRVLARRETNIGHSGVSVYWSAGRDDNWISYYEVKRGAEILGKVSIGTSYFDHAPGWDADAAYAVRAVDGDGNVSLWTTASKLAGEPASASALGGLFPQRGRECWCADTTRDGLTFSPMGWIQPPKTSSADEGGTPNQPGGIEGWWEGEGGARLGRAWMQSSEEACSVRTWVAPQAGRVRVVSRVMKEWYSQASGPPLRARMLHNDKQVWPANGWADIPLNDLVGATHDVVLDVAAGDIVRFVLDRAAASQKPAALETGEQWTVFGTCEREDQVASAATLSRTPNALAIGGNSLSRHEVKAEHGSRDLAPLWGGPKEGRTAYVFMPLRAPETAEYALGFGADWWFQAWLDGKPVSDTLATGNSGPTTSNECHVTRLRIEKGEHVLAVRVISGLASTTLTVGTPSPRKHDIVAWLPRITYLEPAQPAGHVGSVVRIRCGAREPYTDRTGNDWSKDRLFQGGRATTNKGEVQGADDPALYLRGRRGNDFTYRIPVSPGLYSVRLRLAEPEYECFFARPFNVQVNGREMLRNFDICQHARGFRKACERVFRYVVPDADGRIVLRFSGGFEPGQKTDQAIVQVIEVAPEIKPVTRIACGSEIDFVDWNSFIWSRDRDFSGGTAIRSSSPVGQASPTPYDQALYQSARSGREFSYALPLPEGLYTVHLKFAELWQKECGQRPMDIQINGRTVWRSWDPGSAAGEVNMAIDLRATNIAPDGRGQITVRVLATGKHDAILQALEVE